MSDQALLRGHSILVLRCDELACTELKRRLERFGASVTLVTTLREVVELTQDRRIDLAFIGYACGRNELKTALEDQGVSYILCGTPAVADAEDADLAQIVRLSVLWKKPLTISYLH